MPPQHTELRLRLSAQGETLHREMLSRHNVETVGCKEAFSSHDFGKLFAVRPIKYFDNKNA